MLNKRKAKATLIPSDPDAYVHVMFAPSWMLRPRLVITP
jgi:hypothetical protein